MKEKIKEFSKKYLIGFIIGMISAGIAVVYAETYFPSNDVTYDNSSSGLESTNVQGAIDELYNTCFPPGPLDGTIFEDKIVTSGDGLYADEYEEGRYFYKGKSPNNYITFNGETAGWRIMSVEADGTIKIVKEEGIGNISWDSNQSINWLTASLNTYLNGTYLNSLSTTAKEKIQSHDWSIGVVTWDNDDIQAHVNAENSKRWTEKIALPTLSEFIRTNTNTSQCGPSSYNSNYSTCKNSTWIITGQSWWTLSPYDGVSTGIITVGFDSGFLDTRGPYEIYNSYSVRPTLYLKSDVKITSGDGSQNNPYTIE